MFIYFQLYGQTGEKMSSQKKLAAFIAKAEEARPKNENTDLEMVKLERDLVHAFVLEEITDFEGQFGLSTCAIIKQDGVKVKTFFNGVERDCLKRFVESNELPIAVEAVRTLKDSEKNEGYRYGFLYILPQE